MATRTKTIEYSFPLSTASLTTGVSRAFTQLAALAIPETTGRVFRSVTLEIFVTESGTVAASCTAFLMGIQLAAVAFSDATVTQTLVNSGENQAFLFQRDVTSYFVTNYTGTTMTCNVRCTATGVTTINGSAKLIITYNYDDASATTRIKTVKIPIDGNIANLTTAFTVVGTTANQWPNLDTFLPEASKVYRDIFFEIVMHDGTTAAVTTQLSMRYDGATTVNDGAWPWTLITDVFYKRIDKLLGLVTTNATHSVEALTGNVGIPWPCLSGVIVVTYEYNHSTSTRIMNSIQLATMDEAGWCGGIATGDKSRFTRDISVQEPGTITLVHSAVHCSFQDAAAVSLDLRIGAQASRVYVHPATVRAGSMSSMRRIDSGAVGGAGMTLARGWNTITLDWFTTSATAGNIGSNMSGIVYLNYTSDKHADGDGAHNHTTHWQIHPNSTGNLVQRKQVVPTVVPIIPEADYWIVGVGYQVIMHQSGTAHVNLALAVQTEVQSAEAEGGGWRNIYSALYASDSEICPVVMYARARSEFKRFPADPDTSRLDVETARDYRFDANVTAATAWQLAMLLTYHTIKYAIAGAITGSGGGTVTIKAHVAAESGPLPKGTEVAATSRAGNGAYSMNWYDNTVPVFVEARESATLIGRSDDGVAV